MKQTRAELIGRIKDLVSAPLWRVEDPTVAALVLSQVNGVSMAFRGTKFELIEIDDRFLDRVSNLGLPDEALQDLAWSLESDIGRARSTILVVEAAVLAAAREWRPVDPRALSVFQDGGRMNTVSFVVQVQNESDSDRCKYALVSLHEETLRGRLAAVEALNKADPGYEGGMFSGGFVHAHFLDASFPINPSDEVPEGQEPFLSVEEFSQFDAEGWALVPPSLIARAEADMAGFIDEVDDVRLLVSPLGMQVCASWALDDGEAFVRSWSVPWDVLGTLSPATA